MLMQICSGLVYAIDEEDVLDSGECGDGVTWSLNEDGTLTISGNGKMDDYVFDEDTRIINSPWDSYAFDINRIVIEEGITSIGQYAFARLPMVETVQIAGSVSEISAHAFAENDSTIIFFDGDAPTFAENALEECYNLTLIYQADTEGWERYFSVSEGMQMELFGGSVNWKSVDENGIIASGNCGTDADSDYEPDDNLTWTLHLDGTLTVEGSGDLCNGWFEEYMGWESDYRSCIRKVILPEGLTGISGNTFSYCRQLEEIKIPAAVTSIGSAAFKECSNLREITFTGDAPVIFNEEYYPAFYDVTATVYYPANNATWINVTGQNYGGNLIWVAKENEGAEDSSDMVASGSCGEKLTWTLSSDGTLTISGEGAMYDYALGTGSGLAPWSEWSQEFINTIAFAEDCEITHIGNYAFRCMYSLESILIPNSVTTIGEGAFESCTALSLVSLPNGLTEIGKLAFAYSMGLEQISFPDSLTKIGAGAFLRSGLTSVRLPNGLKEISDQLFDRCGALETVEVPDTVEVIGKWAFQDCSELSTITIPAGITEIGESAFVWSGLKTIYFKGNPPELGEYAFDEVWYVTAYYPADNAAWTDDVRAQYSNTWTWEPMGAEEPEPPTAPVIHSFAVHDTGLIEIEAACSSEIESVRILYSDTLVSFLEITDIPDGRYENGIYTNSFTSSEILSLRNGSYTFKLTLTDDQGQSSEEAITVLSMNYTVAPVTNLTAQAVENGILLNWTASVNSDVSQYIVERAEYSTGEYIPVATVTATTTSYLNEMPFADGKTYEYRVYVVTSRGMSEAVSVSVTMIAPDTTAPTINDVWPSTKDKVTLCYNGTLQIAALDDVELSHAVFYCDGLLIGEAPFDANGIAKLEWDCSELSGNATLTYVVYDTAKNCAETSADVTIRKYTAPVTPFNLTAEAGFRSAVLSWSYDGDLETLKQFNIYDGNGGMLITSVKNYKHTFRELSEETTYWVEAEDIYGEKSFYTEVTVTPILTEKEPPKAELSAKEMTGVTGTAITFSGASSTDNDRIESYVWDFGDGATGEGVHAEHTYNNAGIYTVTLTVTDRSGNSNITTANVTIYDTLGADATHAVVTVTVMDGYTENIPAVENATVTVYSDGFEIAAKTDASGKAVLVVPKGSHTMTVVKSGFGGKVQQIDVLADEEGRMDVDVYLAQSGVSVIDGQLTAKPMTYDEIVEAGIDVTDPANNHVVRQALEIRFRPAAELEFDLNIDIMINAGGKQVGGTGFGWHTFTPDPDPTPDPDRPKPPITVNKDEWVDPEYSVGVFPVGENAYMVIYGQTHWLKEMFNVELIVFNTSYAEDITDCYAELTLPEGLSLADMLEGQQHERVKVGNGTIEYIDKEVDGVKVGSNVRQINWYVRGDQEGVYNLTANVTGQVGYTPFESSFTTENPIEVFAGSALELTVTLPKSAYHEKEYVVTYELTNVSDKPIYNLSFGFDRVRQFTVERLSNGEEGGIRDIWDEASFANNKTFDLPELAPGESFCVEFKTKFLYEQEFIEFIFGKIPGAEAGYHVAEAFVTTMDGSTTEIPVKIVLKDIEKMSFSQWVWDESLKELVETAVDAAVDFVDAIFFGGVPVVKGGVKIVKLGIELKDEIDGTEQIYEAAISVNGGVKCVTKEEAMKPSNASTYSLRRNTTPGVLVWTDAEDYEIAADGKSMILRSEGNLYILRTGETDEEPMIDVVTKYIDTYGEVQEFTQTLRAADGMDENGIPVGGTYIPDLKTAKYIFIDELDETTFDVPAEDEITTIRFPAYFIAENGEILMQTSNAEWSILNDSGEQVTESMFISDGVLLIDSDAKAGKYTVKLSLEGSDAVKEQPIVLTNDDSMEHPCVDEDHDHKCDYGCGNVFGGHKDSNNDHICDYGCSEPIGTCEDKNLDHACDYGCDKVFGEHKDSDSNHVCDYDCSDPIGTCEDEILDHKCDYGCGNVFGEHKDSNNDHICDYGCSEPIGTCEDKDFDHACDYGCDKVFVEHKDSDSNHVCDYGCSDPIGTCEDKDFDHDCDYGCGKSYGEHKDINSDHVCDYCKINMTECFDGNDADHDCDICGAENITDHSFSRAWSYNADTHWHDATCGHNVISDKSAHEFGNDRSCDVCGHTKPKDIILPVFPIIPHQMDDMEKTENDGNVPVSEVPSAELQWQNPFSDINKSDWFYEDVKYMSEKGIMIGTDDTTFAPDATLTRAMLVTVLWRLEGEPVVNYIMPFDDVESEQWYTEAVRWAAAERIVKGYGNGAFGTNDAVTREQIMAILHRYAARKELDFGMIFPMIPQYEYSIWAENDLIWADIAGLTDGIGVDIFDMTKDASRAEIAAYLKRFCEGIDVE